ncbi:MAG: DUF1016 N-terminal domain-containing protein [Peptostreptococcaceae bacterium]|nr:DUF1016 N-terminal domain-containing protein [Peptostreptococcaceae bacterium]
MNTQSKRDNGRTLLKLLNVNLQKEFPDMTGLSKENLKHIRYWYRFYSEGLMRLQPVTRLENAERKIKSVPWGHNGRNFSSDWNRQIQNTIQSSKSKKIYCFFIA